MEAGDPGDSSSMVRFRRDGEWRSDPANVASRSGKTGGGHHESTQPPLHAPGHPTYKNYTATTICIIYTVFRKKTPTHIFFHISMSDM